LIAIDRAVMRLSENAGGISARLSGIDETFLHSKFFFNQKELHGTRESDLAACLLLESALLLVRMQKAALK